MQSKYEVSESGLQSRESADGAPGDGHSSEESDTDFLKTAFDARSICALAIVTVIGGQYYEWNAYLIDGFGFFAVAQIVMALAYIIYVTSIAEIVSAFPFSGGGFGLARVAQGYYVGFLVGCLEALEYIAYSALSFLYLSEQICVLSSIDKYYAIAFAFVFYVIAGVMTIHRGRLYLQLTYVLAGISVVVLLVYCFGTMKYVDFMENASLDESDDNRNVKNWYRGGMKTFMRAMPSATIAYGGIEAMALLPTLTVEPKKNIPRGMLWAMAVLFVCNMLVVVVFASQPGGIIATAAMDYPMTVGFSLMFQMPAMYGKLLMLPAQFAEGFGFILCFGKLLQALGSTNLLPSFLHLKNCHDHTNGVIVGCSLGFFICCIYRAAGQDLMDQCVMLGFLTYLSQLHGYWMLKTKYSTSVREFHSPFGLVGVAYCAVVFVLGAIGIIAWENDHATLIIVCTIIGVLSVYYFACAAKSQTMAEEEMAVLFQLHVAKFNKRKKAKPSKKIATRPNMVVPIIRKLSGQSLVEVCVESSTEMPSQFDSSKPTLRTNEGGAVGRSDVLEKVEEGSSMSFLETDMRLASVSHSSRSKSQEEKVDTGESVKGGERATPSQPEEVAVVCADASDNSKESGVESLGDKVFSKMDIVAVGAGAPEVQHREQESNRVDSEVLAESGQSVGVVTLDPQ